MKEQLVLASASPRRKELLDQIGVSYRIHAVTIDETPIPSELPQDYVQRVAAEKSAQCLVELKPLSFILAADTSVVIDGQILGKPIDREQAELMLTLLSGKTHQVMTAVSLRTAGIDGSHKHFQILSVTNVCFRKINRNEIAAYWRTGEPLGKAGAYAIQGVASIFVQSIEGSYSGVMGLPLFETAELLSKQGIKIIR
ncbi:MAG: septum formation inhibitor Maf [Methylococcales symbiont of Iophon sp. n. MRB-2018]|nr:MAG: septum formation inhibitor Maf [Methylococcales symbiont of Iophon sp. n. MRB-2018]KAF3980593.1 MAG: septum formation inhibitor Maf [Methylococcales symbiont of Iophon sp. n. MRB-2018]